MLEVAAAWKRWLCSFPDGPEEGSALARNAWPLTGMESGTSLRMPSTTTASMASVGMADRLGSEVVVAASWLERLRIRRRPARRWCAARSAGRQRWHGAECLVEEGMRDRHPAATTSWERCADILVVVGAGRRVRRCRHPTGEGARNTWSGGRRTANGPVRTVGCGGRRRMWPRGQPPHRSSTGQGGGLAMSEDYLRRPNGAWSVMLGPRKRRPDGAETPNVCRPPRTVCGDGPRLASRWLRRATRCPRSWQLLRRVETRARRDPRFPDEGPVELARKISRKSDHSGGGTASTTAVGAAAAPAATNVTTPAASAHRLHRDGAAGAARGAGERAGRRGHRAATAGWPIRLVRTPR